MLKAPSSPVEREVANSSGVPVLDRAELFSPSEFRVVSSAPSPSHVQEQNPARGLKQAEIFMPHPEDQTYETELMPLERNRGGIFGD